MSKRYKIEYSLTTFRSKEILANNEYEALKIFREDQAFCQVNNIKYIYDESSPLQEWYCIWWNGISWKSKIIEAHDKEEIECNIKDKLDNTVFDFHCCPNNKKAIDSVHRCIWD